MHKLIIKVTPEEDLGLEGILIKNPFLFKGTFFYNGVGGLTPDLYLTFNPETAISYSIAKTLHEIAKGKNASPIVVIYFPYEAIFPDYPISTIESVLVKINERDKYEVISLEEVIKSIEHNGDIVTVTYSQKSFLDFLSNCKSIDQYKINNLVNSFFDEIESDVKKGKLSAKYLEQLNYFLTGHPPVLYDNYFPFSVIHVPSMIIFPRYMYYHYRERIEELLNKINK